MPLTRLREAAHAARERSWVLLEQHEAKMVPLTDKQLHDLRKWVLNRGWITAEQQAQLAQAIDELLQARVDLEAHRIADPRRDDFV